MFTAVINVSTPFLHRFYTVLPLFTPFHTVFIFYTVFSSFTPRAVIILPRAVIIYRVQPYYLPRAAVLLPRAAVLLPRASLLPRVLFIPRPLLPRVLFIPRPYLTKRPDSIITGTGKRCGSVTAFTPFYVLRVLCLRVTPFTPFSSVLYKSGQKGLKTASVRHRVRSVKKRQKARSECFGVGTCFILRRPETVLPGTERLFR